MFIAMNNFQIATGKEQEFESIWRERDTFLQDVPGFLDFALLRGDETGEYVSHSVWESREAFVAWTQSESFVKGHRQASMSGIVDGPPHVKLYESVIVEHAGASATTAD